MLCSMSKIGPKTVIARISATQDVSSHSVALACQKIHITNNGPNSAFMSTVSDGYISQSLTFDDDLASGGDSAITGAGNFITAGFAIGDTVIVSGSVSNNGTVSVPIKTLSATVMTFNGIVLVDEGPVASTLRGPLTVTDSTGFEITSGYTEVFGILGGTEVFFVCTAAQTAELSVAEEC